MDDEITMIAEEINDDYLIYPAVDNEGARPDIQLDML